MSLKDKMIRKLLDTGKKHRILVYPTLALVAVISAISHAVYWGKGNGKKLIASAMVMVLLISQSLFLTSSADVSDNHSGSAGTASGTDAVYTAGTDAEDDDFLSEDSSVSEDGLSADGLIDSTQASDDVMPLDDAATTMWVYFYRVNEGGSIRDANYRFNASLQGDGSYLINGPTFSQFLSGSPVSDYYAEGYDKLFYDAACSQPVSDDGNHNYTIDPEQLTDNRIYFKATRTNYPATFYDDLTGNILLSNTKIPATVEEGNIYPSVSYLVSKETLESLQENIAYRYGYDFTALQYGSSSYNVGSTIEIENPGDSLVFTLQWKPMNYTVTYNPIGNGESFLDKHQEGELKQEYTYGKSVTILSEADIVEYASQEAYYLDHWEDGGKERYDCGVSYDSSALTIEGTLKNNPNITGKTLSAVWEYKDVVLVSDGERFNGDTIEGYYGDPINLKIEARYRKDNSTGTKFTYVLSDNNAEMWNEYGLNYTQNTDGTYQISGQLKNITEDEPVTFTVTVYDENKPGDTGTPFPITIVSHKRPVTIDGSTVKDAAGNSPRKEYDGKITIGLSGRASVNNRATGDVVTDTDEDVYVSYDPQTAVFDTPNAGDAKNIILSNVQLQGRKAGFYTLEGVYGEDKVQVDGIGRITPKSMDVTMKLRDTEKGSSVRYGEDDPAYTLRLVNPEELIDTDYNAYMACTTDDDFDRFMRDYLGFTGYFYGGRVLYSEPTTYTVSANFGNSANRNYANTTLITDQMTVTRDEGILGVNYLLNDKQPNGYYQGLEIRPYGDYDRIRLISATGSEVVGDAITLDMTRSDVNPMFNKTQLTKDDFPDMKNGTVVFQLMSTKTGAVSAYVTLTNVNIDTVAPELVNVTVTPIQFINEFNFGSYYHSQLIDNSLVEYMTIKFEFYEDDSEGDVTDEIYNALYYYFTDADGNPIGDINRAVKFSNTKNGGGYYEAIITIGTADYGQLVVYAKDKTGNESIKKRIRLSEIDDLKAGMSYYEWMTENNIDKYPIEVKSLSGAEASTNTWYNGLQLIVNAMDTDSGVNRINWVVTKPSGEELAFAEDVLQVFADAKQTEYTFRSVLPGEYENLEIGEYKIRATFYDNAGNSVELDQVGPYLLDCIKPTIEDISDNTSGNFLSGVNFEFSVTEGEGESGISMVSLYRKSGNGDLIEVRTWNADDPYYSEFSHHITDNGNYVVKAWDVAGNVAEFEKSFSGISEEEPDAPTIIVEDNTTTRGNGDWYINQRPWIKITSSTETVDKVPVTTHYSVIVAGSSVEQTFTTDELEFPIESDGKDITISAWAVSASGKKSATVTKTISVDTVAPEIMITESTIDANGNVTINFKATDAVSGINRNEVYLNGEFWPTIETEGGVLGSFTANENRTYTLTVKDVAGNVSDEFEFVPLSINVKPITEIGTNSVDLNVDIIEGTYPVADYYIAYKKSTDSSYQRCYSITDENNDLKDITALFRNLQSNTKYDYKVYARTSTSMEVKTYEGSFRTLSTTATGSIYGNVSYDDDLIESLQIYPIYVNLYQGNTCIAGVRIEEGQSGDYLFKNISDGAYQVVATNGILTRTSSVIVQNGGVLYPSDYAKNGGINFVLDGFSTSLEIEDNEIEVTVDNLESYFDWNVYLTPEERKAVENGEATLKITLHAKYIDVSSNSGIFRDQLSKNVGSNVEIVRYIELNVSKEVFYNDGRYTYDEIPALPEPVTISFPLGNLAGQQIYVASLHKGLDGGYDFYYWNGSNVTISRDYVMIQTQYFSEYALYRMTAAKKTYTVKWIDGDGNVMKTETVQEGKAATPPTKIPTKSATDKYTYTFSGWDTDYSNITKDTNILAYFVANKRTDTGDGNDNGGGNQNGQQPPSTTVTPSNGNNGGSGDITTSPNRYTYLGSANSPKTGDGAPIAVIAFVMVLAAGGMVVLGKKQKN